MISHSQDKEEVLKSLVEKVGQGESETFSKEILHLMARREQLSSVVFSDEIAVPHPIKPLAHHHRIGVALLPEGLFWNEDFPQIHLVFLPSPSIFENEEMASLTTKIVDLLDQPDLQEEMLACQSFDEFRQLFMKL